MAPLSVGGVAALIVSNAAAGRRDAASIPAARLTSMSTRLARIACTMNRPHRTSPSCRQAPAARIPAGARCAGRHGGAGGDLSGRGTRRRKDRMERTGVHGHGVRAPSARAIRTPDRAQPARHAARDRDHRRHSRDRDHRALLFVDARAARRRADDGRRRHHPRSATLWCPPCRRILGARARGLGGMHLGWHSPGSVSRKRVSMSVATTLPRGATRSHSHRAIDPAPAPTSRHRQPGRGSSAARWRRVVGS